MSSLTDRYLGVALGGIPQQKRADVERELRSSIADAVDDRVGAGEDRDAAERAVLEGMGDPSRLSAEMTGRPMYLIGPGLFPTYRALLGLSLTLIVPLTGVIAGAVSLIGGGSVGEWITAGLGAALNVAVWLGFWLTLVFAIIERADTAKMELAKQSTGDLRVPSAKWTVDNLPVVPSTRITIGDTVGESFGLIVGVVGLLILRSITWTDAATGQQIPIFQPSLNDFWLPFLVAVLASQIGFRVVLYLVGRWTWALAVSNAVLQLLFAIPLVYLATSGMLINPAFAESIGSPAIAAGNQPVMLLVAAGAVLVSAWEIFDGFRQARRADNVAAAAREV